MKTVMNFKQSKLYLLVFIGGLLFLLIGCDKEDSTIYPENELIESFRVPDNNFEQELINLGYDDVIDGWVIKNNVIGITDLELNFKGISDLTGIKYFKDLRTLQCNNNQLTSLDVSNNNALVKLYCSTNQLTSLDVSNSTTLTTLVCDFNQLTSLDVSNCTALIALVCDFNQLTSLDVSNNTNLIALDCQKNQLTSLDISNSTALIELYCGSNQLTSLDVSNNNALGRLSCQNNQLTSLDVSNNPLLTLLSCFANLITCIQVNPAQFSSIPTNWPKDGSAVYSTICPVP